MFLRVGVDVGNLMKLKMEEAGIATPPTFYIFRNFLRPYAFMKMQDTMNVLRKIYSKENSPLSAWVSVSWSYEDAWSQRGDLKGKQG